VASFSFKDLCASAITFIDTMYDLHVTVVLLLLQTKQQQQQQQQQQQPGGGVPLPLPSHQITLNVQTSISDAPERTQFQQKK
jgi:hypothetical protein